MPLRAVHSLDSACGYTDSVGGAMFWDGLLVSMSFEFIRFLVQTAVN